MSGTATTARDCRYAEPVKRCGPLQHFGSEFAIEGRPPAHIYAREIVGLVLETSSLKDDSFEYETDELMNGLLAFDSFAVVPQLTGVYPRVTLYCALMLALTAKTCSVVGASRLVGKDTLLRVFVPSMGTPAKNMNVFTPSSGPAGLR